MKEICPMKRKYHYYYLYSFGLPQLLIITVLVLLVLFLSQGRNIFNKFYSPAEGVKNNEAELKDETGAPMEENIKTKLFTSSDLDKMIKDQASGKSIGSYSITDASGLIKDQSLVLKIDLSDGTVINADLIIPEPGDRIVLNGLSLQNAGILESIKETLIRTFINTSIDTILKAGSGTFVKAEIKDGTLKIYYK